MDRLRKVVRNMRRGRRNQNMMITSFRNKRINFLGRCETLLIRLKMLVLNVFRVEKISPRDLNSDP